jgi:hypothetical protein
LKKRLGLKEIILKKTGARQWYDEAGAVGKMGQGARLEQEEEMRRGKKSRLAVGNYAQRAKGI